MRNLVILDDLMTSSAKDPRMNELFTEGSHHRNLSVIALNQNLYFNKDPTQRRNCHYLVLFNNPVDQQPVMTLARQMYPGNHQHLVRRFKEATSKPYGYMVIDLKPFTHEHQRLRTDIFDPPVYDRCIKEEDHPQSTHCEESRLEPYIRERLDTNCHLIGNHQIVRTYPEPIREEFVPDIEDPKERMAHYGSTQDYPHFKSAITKEPTVSQDLRSYPWPSKHSNTEKVYPACVECGTMFASSYDLQRHIKNGCPMEEDTDENDTMSDDENDTMSDVNKEDDDEGFTSLVDEVWEENKTQFNKKFDQLKKENADLSDKEAREEVSEMMLHKDRTLLQIKYKRILVLWAKLNKSKLHREIKKTVTSLVTEQNMDLDKAISHAFKKYRYEFEELLEADEDNYKEETTDESDDETED